MMRRMSIMKPASQAAWQDSAPTDVAGREERIAPAPRISVQAFCETVETAAAIQAAGEDRRMAKAHLRIQMGGLIAAVEAYQNAPTPNVIILERDNRSEDILNGLDQLAPLCDAQTRVIIISRMNDVALYRELVRRGVSDYLIAPVSALQAVRAVCGLFSAPDAKPVGRIIAVVGAKGGVGASTIAHNVAFFIARDLMLDWWLPTSISPSAPSASISTRIRRKASPKRYFRPTVSTMPLSTGFSPNVPTI